MQGTRTLSTRVNESLYCSVRTFLDSGQSQFINESDYLRDLIRKDMKNRGMLENEPQKEQKKTAQEGQSISHGLTRRSIFEPDNPVAHPLILNPKGHE